jgi:hypothetical protein
MTMTKLKSAAPRHTATTLALALALGLVMADAAPAMASSGPIAIASGDAIKGTQSVVIGAFTVGFIFQSVDNTQATGGMIGAFGGVTSAKSELVGVTPVMMQAITDAAYADFKARIATAGFAVAESAPLFTSPQFARAKPGPGPFETKVGLGKNSNGKVTFYKPSALPSLVMVPGDFTATSGFGGLGAIGATMSETQTAIALGEYAKASGQSVIDVVYLIDFSDATRPGLSSLGGGVNITSGLSVASNYSKLTVINTKGKVAHLTLKESVAIGGDFATMKDQTKDKGLQSGLNILGGLAAARGFGGMKFGKSRTYVFTVNPEAYEQGAAQATSLANTRLVEQLAALK